MSTITYPPSKATEIGRKFIKAVGTPLPPFLKRVNVLATTGGQEGMKGLSIYEVDDGKVTEGIKELNKYYVQFYEVEGFRYQVEPMLTAEEALPLLGL